MPLRPQDEPVEPILPDEPDPPVTAPLLLEDWLAVAVLALLALITLANVLVRYLSDQSFAFTEEISIFLLVVLTLVAGGTAFVRNFHIRIEIFADNGSAARQRFCRVFGSAASCAFFAMLTVLATRLVLDEFQYDETSPAMGVPTWWYTIWLPICSAIITLRTAGMTVRAWRGQP